MMRNQCSCGNSDRTKNQLMDQIQESSFAVYDTLLYMDTHPTDMDAMAYFHKQSCIRQDAMQEYAKHFGPITMYWIDETNRDTWEWMTQPWPWEVSKKGRC